MKKIKPDHMVVHDDLIITNHIETRGVAPRGRLFQILGTEGDRRVVREIACNTVVVGGAIAALENLTGAEASWKPSTINSIYGVDTTSTRVPMLSLFGIGVGGANLDFGSVIATDIKQRDILSPIPLRYGTELTGTDADMYFMKVANSGDSSYSWYLKEFTGTPIIKSCWKNSVSSDADGTEILTDIYNSQNAEGIETFVELQIDLNALDGREYFEATGAMSYARYNTIGFYTGALNADGTEYANVRLYSVVTFNNRSLDISTSSQYLYRVYGLV